MKGGWNRLWRVLALLGLSAGMAQATDYKPFINHYISGTKGGWDYRIASGQVYSYLYFDIGTDCASFTLDTGYDGHGGSGDCDLYLGLGYKPSATRYVRRSQNVGYKERITVVNPPAGITNESITVSPSATRAATASDIAIRWSPWLTTDAPFNF